MKRFLGTLVVTLVAVFVSLALLELGARLTLGEQVKFPRRVVGAPSGLRINEPNARSCLSGCLNRTPYVVGGSTASAARDPHDRWIPATVKRRAVVSPVDRPRRRFVAWGESGARISSAVVGDWDIPRPSSVANPAIG